MALVARSDRQRLRELRGQGRVVDSYTGDQAEADIDSLAQKYIGQSPYPWRSPGEQRITFLVEPTHVFGMGR